jgi:putative ABC transport system permease protein
MLKNAIAYILRKRNRTIIVFIILTVVLSCLYSCLNISKSTSNLEKDLYKISNTSLSITKNNGDTFETNQFKELDNIKEIKEIITVYDGLARTTNIKVVDGTQLIERDDLSDEYKNMLSVEATNNSEKNNLFSSGVFTIIKGRHINNDDRGKILIHKELAEKNKLNLNDKIKLELIDFNNSKKKMEYEFEIIGIFTGKKQEKYTGLSSDFSENMVFIDYESSQKALNKYENNKIVSKLEIFSDSSENTKVALNKIKKIKTAWSQYNVSSDNNVLEETLESIDGIKHIINIMTYSIMLSGIIVLSLILILWLRERMHEIGVLLSIGVSKIKIVTQFILELLFISLPSFVLSLFLGNVILNIIVGGFTNSDDSTIMVDSLLKNNNLISNLIIFLESYGILIGIIVLSVIIASLMILIKKPKEILSKIS